MGICVAQLWSCVVVPTTCWIARHTMRKSLLIHGFDFCTNKPLCTNALTNIGVHLATCPGLQHIVRLWSPVKIYPDWLNDTRTMIRKHRVDWDPSVQWAKQREHLFSSVFGHLLRHNALYLPTRLSTNNCANVHDYFMLTDANKQSVGWFQWSESNESIRHASVYVSYIRYNRKCIPLRCVFSWVFSFSAVYI